MLQRKRPGRQSDSSTRCRARVRRRRLRAGAWWLASLLALPLAAPGPAHAHESDQYSLPAGRDFAELGPHFSRIVHAALVEAVADANRQGIPADDPLQAADRIGGLVWQQLFLAMPTNEVLDADLSSAALHARYPGLVTVYYADRWIYDDPLLVLDPTKLVRLLFRAGTVAIGGIPVGTDKLIHFVNLGRIYHGKYLSGRRHGLSPQQATARAIASTSRNPLTSEDGVLGLASTGIRSNADLAADYAGLLFYRNLTEPVRIGARELPPMLVHDDGHWRLQVQADADFFTAFVTPHWNEVLNPNTYLGYVGERVRARIRERCAQVLAAYPDARGRPMGREQFARIEQQLATFYGEPYDHRSDPQQPVDVATLCFPQTGGDAAPLPAPPPVPDGIDAQGRTPLWWAARLGQLDQAEAITELRAQLNAADVDGETPLHAAVRANDPALLRWLLARGADPNRGARYGVTPLLLAADAGRLEAAAALLQAGADPDRPGPFGHTALQASVRQGDGRLTELLLAHAADPMRADDQGNTALHLAALIGAELPAQRLLAHRASPDARNALGASPIDLAQQQGYAALAQRLDDARTQVASRPPGPRAAAGDAGAALAPGAAASPR